MSGTDIRSRTLIIRLEGVCTIHCTISVFKAYFIKREYASSVLFQPSTNRCQIFLNITFIRVLLDSAYLVVFRAEGNNINKLIGGGSGIRTHGPCGTQDFKSRRL